MKWWKTFLGINVLSTKVLYCIICNKPYYFFLQSQVTIFVTELNGLTFFFIIAFPYNPFLSIVIIYLTFKVRFCMYFLF